MNRVIEIEELNILPLGFAQCTVPSSLCSRVILKFITVRKVFAVGMVFHPIINHFRCVVCRPVIDDNDFNGAAGLHYHTFSADYNGVSYLFYYRREYRQ